jgi:hypothetical protein
VITVAEEQSMRMIDVEAREFNNQAKRFLELLLVVTSFSEDALYLV